MPFESSSQRRWMYANKPAMAAEWEAHTPKGKKLPDHVKKKEACDRLLRYMNDLAIRHPEAQPQLRKVAIALLGGLSLPIALRAAQPQLTKQAAVAAGHTMLRNLAVFERQVALEKRSLMGAMMGGAASAPKPDMQPSGQMSGLGRAAGSIHGGLAAPQAPPPGAGMGPDPRLGGGQSPQAVSLSARGGAGALPQPAAQAGQMGQPAPQPQPPGPAAPPAGLPGQDPFGQMAEQAGQLQEQLPPPPAQGGQPTPPPAGPMGAEEMMQSEGPERLMTSGI